MMLMLASVKPDYRKLKPRPNVPTEPSRTQSRVNFLGARALAQCICSGETMYKTQIWSTRALVGPLTSKKITGNPKTPVHGCWKGAVLVHLGFSPLRVSLGDLGTMMVMYFLILNL